MCKIRIEAGIDPCLEPLLKVLNDNGFKTDASCCGHGHQPALISLADGREIFIMPNFEASRRLNELFRGINGEPPKRAGILDHLITVENREYMERG